MNDTLSDTIVRIKQAQLKHKKEVQCINSNLIRNLMTILWKEGLIEGYTINDKYLLISLHYKENLQPALTFIRRCSKPGSRIYLSSNDVKKLAKNTLPQYGFYILSTNKGLVTSQQAIEFNVGGELLCRVG